MPELNTKESPSQPECCCGPRNFEIKHFRNIQTSVKISTKSGEVEIATNNWSFNDYLGAILVRMGFMRMNYAVKPGLYAIGKPNDTSPVFVSANYKLSFDILRRDLSGIDGWILVIDTKGVNVWCAAGKGTFGTKEIVARVISTGLSEIVSHRNLIVPQLGAPGVSAFKVLLFSAFKVIYGPVRSADIKKFMANGMKADSKMRKINFGLRDRLTVSVLELVIALEKLIPFSIALVVVYALAAGGFSLKTGLTKSLLPLSALLLAVLTGTVFTAGLLPYLPGKAFSIKGGILGAIASLALIILADSQHIFSLKSLSIVLFVSSISSYLALNFTGSSTFTSLSGTKKEVRFSLPVIISVFVVSIITYFLKGA
jgi:hypothetical protein